MRTILSAFVAAYLVLTGSDVGAQAAPEEREINLKIDSQTLAGALDQWAAQTGIHLISPSWAIAQKLAATPLKGPYTARQALEKLLNGTPLTMEWVNDKAVAIREKPQVPPPASLQSSGADSKQDVPLARFSGALEAADGSSAGSSESLGRSARPAGQGADDDRQRYRRQGTPEELETVVVTGSHIVGAKPVTPIITLSHNDIAQKGFTRLDQVLQHLPQNSRGGASQESNPTNGIGENATTNYAFSSGVNLRGLGARATLVLLNGRRLPETSYGNATDISKFPLSIIDRVEILTDGASATYGADAVAGVVNIITRKDFSGIETGGRVTGVSEGKDANVGGYVVGGANWSSGNLVATYDYEQDAALNSSERSFSQNLGSEIDLLPRLTTNSWYLSLQQALSNALTLQADSFYSDRSYRVHSGSFDPGEVKSGTGDQVGVNANLSYQALGGWVASLDGSYSQSVDHDLTNSPSAQTRLRLQYDTASVEPRVSGPLFDMPGGPVRAAVGGVARREKFSQQRNDTPTISNDRDVRSAYAEISIPVISAENATAFAKELTVSASARYDDYSDFGSTTNPKFALRFRPSESVGLFGSYGTSFRTPTLFNLADGVGRFALVLDVPDPSMPGGTRRALLLDDQGNVNLAAEEATSVSFGIEFAPPDWTGFNARLSYFKIEFRDKIVRVSDEVNFFDPIASAAELGHFLTFDPTTSEVSQALATPGQDLFDLTGTFSGDPAEVQLLGRLGTNNAATSDPEGVDLFLTTAFDTRVGRFQLNAAGTYFISYEKRFLPNSDPIDGFDDVGYPTRLRANAELVWRRDLWVAYGRLNHANAYPNRYDSSCSGAAFCEVSSYNTVDLGLSREFVSVGSFLKGAWIALDVMNALDESPPFVGGLPNTAAFDGTNASPLGRAVSLAFNARF
jgi:iron complex outermembrane receptor protein